MPRDKNPSLSQTCIVCRQRLINQLKLNCPNNKASTPARLSSKVGSCQVENAEENNSSFENSDKDVNKMSRWRVLCLETLSMLFGLPVDHPFLTVFVDTTTTSEMRRNGDTKGQLCNRCLQDISNVQFVFWQLQNLERKLSELQALIFDRLRSNYEALPVALLFGRYIGVDDLRNDLHNLKYDEIVKILFEEIKSRKTEWPKPLHTKRWKQACENADHISQTLINDERLGPDTKVPESLSSSPSPETIVSGLLHPDDHEIKVEVDPPEPVLQPLDYPPFSEEAELVTPDAVVKKRPSNKRVSKKRVRFELEEEEIVDNCDDDETFKISADEADSDGEWTLATTSIKNGPTRARRRVNPSKRQTRSRKKRTINKKSKVEPKSSVVEKALSAMSGIIMEDARYLCTEDPENCSRTYGSKKHLRNHVERFHKARKFPCEEKGCSAGFVSSKSLTIHMIRVHQKKQPKELCAICGLEFTQRNMRKHYYFRHQGVGKFKCDRCSMDFTDLELFQSHEQLHQSAEYPFLCVECQQLFTNSLDLKSHVASNHLSSGLKCHICNVMKPNEFLMQRHLKIHDRVKNFTCNQCNKAFSTQAYLKYHMDHYHENADRTFPCEVCGKTFRHEKNVKRHLISHQEEKPFKCSQCPKTFNYSHLLKKHEEIHSNTKNYECDLCGKKFRQQQNLVQHFKSHRPKPERAGRKRGVKMEGIDDEPVEEISYEIHQDADDKDAIPMILQVKGDMGSMNMTPQFSHHHHQMLTTAATSSSLLEGTGRLIEATIIPAAEITEDEHGNPTAQYETVQEIQLHHSQDLSQTQTATVVFLYDFNA